jgi:hypothetical protein
MALDTHPIDHADVLGWRDYPLAIVENGRVVGAVTRALGAQPRSDR